jgi:hypothetical protein
MLKVESRSENPCSHVGEVAGDRSIGQSDDVMQVALAYRPANAWVAGQGSKHPLRCR